MRQLRYPGQTAAKFKDQKRLKPTLIKAAILLLALFILANAVMWIMYQNRLLPNYRLGGVTVGGWSYADLDQKLTADRLLPTTVTLATNTKQQKIAPTDLGVHVDTSANLKALKEHRSWLPALSLVRDRTVPLQLSLDDNKYKASVQTVVSGFSKAPVPNHVVFANDRFMVAPAQKGTAVLVPELKTSLVKNLERGKQTIPVPLQSVVAPPDKDLSGEVSRLQKQLNGAVIDFVYGDTHHKMQKSDIGAWYIAEGQTMALSTERIKSRVDQIAKSNKVTIQNIGEAATAGAYALTKETALTFRLVSDKNTVLYHYCAAQRGVSDVVLPELKQKLSATFGDTRGWNNNGNIAFVYGDAKCDFTVWLSAADQMPSFGSICDSTYSCQVGSNVVINYDRWRYGTDPWNKAGLGLEDYRVLAINHETGHWLGFGHPACPGAGQAAPVMMQQSIDLGGCKFNPWPLTTELDELP